MTPKEILERMIEFKKIGNIDGFIIMVNSLSQEELKKLSKFAGNLKEACEARIKEVGVK